MTMDLSGLTVRARLTVPASPAEFWNGNTAFSGGVLDAFTFGAQ